MQKTCFSLVDDSWNPVAIPVKQETIYPNLFVSLNKAKGSWESPYGTEHNLVSKERRTATHKLSINRRTDVMVDRADTK